VRAQLQPKMLRVGFVGMQPRWGWSPSRIGSGMRFMALGDTVPCNSYSVRIPVERTPVRDGRQYFGEVSKGKQTPTEADVLASAFERRR